MGQRKIANMSSPSSAGPRHHTVPRFHLQPFAVGRNKRRAELWEYDKRDDAIRQVCVRDAGVVPSFYTLPSGSGGDSAIDDVLRHIENRTAPVMAQLATAGVGPLPIPDADRWTLSLYMAILNRRVPVAAGSFREQIEAMRKMWTLDVLQDREAFQAIWDSEGRSRDPRVAERTRLQFLDLMQNRGYRLVASPEIGLAGLGGAPQEALRIACGTWALLRRDQHPAFIIGDAPAKLLSPHPSAEPMLEPSGAGFRWQMPVTPTTALVVLAQQPDAAEKVLNANAADPTLDTAWRAVLPPMLQRDAAFFHGVMAWRMAERWVWARDRADLERIASGFSDEDRRMAASVLHRTSGFIRANDPHHIRVVLDEATQRLATRQRRAERARGDGNGSGAN